MLYLRTGSGRCAGAAEAVLHLLFSAALLASGCAGEGSPPDVIWITLDALRADHLGSYGYDRPTSPFLDQLAAEGVRMEMAISQAPSTKASVASMFTSLHPSVHKAISHGKAGRRGDVLPDEAVTLAERLRAAGYLTAGLVANPHLRPDFGFSQGFQFYRHCYPQKWATAEELLAEARAWYENAPTPAGDPYFLYLHLMDTHHPYRPPEPYRGQFLAPSLARWSRDCYVNGKPETPPAEADIRYLRDLYDGSIRYADAQLADFFTWLRASGRMENLLVVLTADHGDEFMEHGGLGHGQTLFQEQLHIPLIMVLPGLLPAGRLVRTPVSLIDVGPTILALAGVPPDLETILGRDFSPRWSDSAPGGAISPVFSEKRRKRSLIIGRQKLIFRDDDPTADGALYDLEHDSGELEDRASLNPADIGELARQADAYLARVKALDRRLGLEQSTAPVDQPTRDQLGKLGYLE